jgi:hypothetical protein
MERANISKSRAVIFSFSFAMPPWRQRKDIRDSSLHFPCRLALARKELSDVARLTTGKMKGQ